MLILFGGVDDALKIISPHTWSGCCQRNIRIVRSGQERRNLVANNNLWCVQLWQCMARSRAPLFCAISITSLRTETKQIIYSFQILPAFSGLLSFFQLFSSHHEAELVSFSVKYVATDWMRSTEKCDVQLFEFIVLRSDNIVSPARWRVKQRYAVELNDSVILSRILLHSVQRN